MLSDRILAFLMSQPNNAASDWSIALALYPDFGKPNPANGARIANIRKACFRHPQICQLSDGRTYSILPYTRRGQIMPVDIDGADVPERLDPLPCGGVPLFDDTSGCSYLCDRCLTTVGSIGMPMACAEMVRARDEFRQRIAASMLYAGIGSRKTPPAVLARMTRLATRLSQLNYILRSGAADGADSAFAAGCNGESDIWLPWKGFNGCFAGNFPTAEHEKMATTLHPAWSRLSRGAKALHSRNVGQILGGNLKTPVAFVLCWTPDGCESEASRSKDTGGTGTAIALASRHDIPIFNLKNADAEIRMAALINRAQSAA